MAESISSISVASRSGSKIYLSGTACGDSGKNYCINCYVYSNGLTGYVGNNWYNYTYFSGGCLDMEDWECYIPDYGDGKYRIYLDEVSGGCDDITRIADAYTLEVETEPETCNIEIRPVDQDNMQVDATIRMEVIETGRVETKRTYSDLGVYFDIERGYMYSITATSDKCDKLATLFNAPDKSTYWEIMHMECEVKPSTAVVTCYTARTDGTKESGVNVTVDVHGGKTETNQTNSSGIVTFGLLHGDKYTITLTPPYNCNCDCSFCLCEVTDVADEYSTKDHPLRYELNEENGYVIVCSEKNRTECESDSRCYWWDSDSSCHSSPEYNDDAPTLTITNDLDEFFGIDVYVDGVLVGTSPTAIPYSISDAEKSVSVIGGIAGILFTKTHNVVLNPGNNEVKLEILMDNKEILAGGTLASIILLKYM